MGETTEPVDAFDPDRPVGVDTDDGAHLLQHRDQVHDLGLDGRVGELGDALGQHAGQQHLLGGADTRVLQVEFGALSRWGARMAIPFGSFSTTAPNCRSTSMW